MSWAVTGLGLMTSVGHDVRTACAAIRAGIQRPRELTYFTVRDPAEGALAPLVARPVAGYTDGFYGVGLWLRLAQAALRDLQREARLPEPRDTGFWGKTALLAVIPELAAGRFDDDLEITPDKISSTYVELLVHSTGWPILPEHTDTIAIGHAGAIEAVMRADRLLRSGMDRVIVACADSLLDALSLGWLSESGRLKNADNPFGVTPGEAGACFMLEREGAAAERGAQIVALASAWRLAKSRSNPLAGDPMIGDGLAKAFAELLAVERIQSFSGTCICDINGEPWRSQDWGAARVRLEQRLADVARWIFPCESLGDTGSASGAVALCIGTRALQGGYLNSDAVMITSTSDNGTAAALCLRHS